MDHSKKLYFLAVMPSGPLQEEVRDLKLIFRDKFGSGHALNSPAHLTLIPPFFWPLQRTDDLIRSLDRFSIPETPFEVELSRFGAFPPRVIYIDVHENLHLEQLQERLKNYLDDQWKISALLRGHKPFNPHMTIAFRDLSRANFHKAWTEFKNKSFNEVFIVDKIVLLNHHQKNWEVYHQAYFGKN
ncbi:MAG: 2'-5' RNA ligase family protein [Cyclobacteriaceae bacterium]|nr:2'-5' RNA ligase family protein [Cyclobacteriaceae bacterium]